MKKEMIKVSYEFPEFTDEEIQEEIDAEGLTGVVKPEDVRKYIRERLYELYCEAVTNKESNNEI